MDKILIFIPGYNCEKQITRVLGQLTADVMEYITEVIMVNNRSTDGTEDAVLEFKKKNPEIPVKLLRNDKNYNLGGSHKVAFGYAIENGFNYVIVLHGDDQGNIRDILPVLKSSIYKKYDCCLGSRFMKGSTLPGYSKFRILGNRVYNIIFSVSTMREVKDLGSGLNMYSTEMLKSRFYMKFSDTLMFNCYMLLANSYYNFKTYYFPISWREEDQISNVRMFSQAMKTLKIAGEYIYSRKKGYIEREFRENPVKEYTAKEIEG